MTLSQIIDTILHNQVVTGLSFTALLGAVAYQLRSLPRLLREAILRFMTVELSVTSTDPAFDWLDRWLAQQPYAKRAKMLMLRSHDDQIDDFASRNDMHNVAWSLSPGPGLHIFWWRKRPVFLERQFLSKDADARRSKPVETLRFRTIGRSQKIIRRLIDDVRAFSESNECTAIRLWTDGYWNIIRGKSIRRLDTIILRDGQIERILADLHWFHDAHEWYRIRGIPYRRGYLLSGPPGTGKTSLVLALAGHLNRPICVLSLSAVSDDTALFSAFNEAPPNAIILLEDVDCGFPAQTRDDPDKPAGKVTKAGLLNAIDGITTPDGRIFIMTTNYPERLDAALVRPGRADVHETFEYLNAAAQRRMAARFYDQEFVALASPVSPAVLQAAFMVHPDDPHAARLMLQDADCALCHDVPRYSNGQATMSAG